MTNEYGLDVSYFQGRLKRLGDLSGFKPDELARELLRMALAADPNVILEDEFIAFIEVKSGQQIDIPRGDDK